MFLLKKKKDWNIDMIWKNFPQVYLIGLLCIKLVCEDVW